MDIDRELNTRMARRLRAEDKALARQEKLAERAKPFIGELCRNGETVYYVFPAGGKYREGGYFELVAYLSRVGIIRA